MNNLKVQLPVRFKEQFERRWNPENAEKWEFRIRHGEPGIDVFAIHIPNPLCKEYNHCKGCPFNKFAPTKCPVRGCEYWMDLVLEKPDHYSTFFMTFEDKIIYTLGGPGLRDVEELKRRAKKLTEWV